MTKFVKRVVMVRAGSVAQKSHKKKRRRQSAPAMFGMRMPRFRGF